MKRWIWILLALLVLGSVAGVGAPIAANTDPPGELPPRAYACYETCVLPSYIIAEDFNQDSWLDLAVACEGSSQVFRYNNARAGGLFTVPPTAYNVGGGPVALASGQMDTGAGAPRNFDGLPDLAALSTSNPPTLTEFHLRAVWAGLQLLNLPDPGTAQYRV